MAGDWIKIETALPDKPEVWQMAGILGIDADSVVGKLIRVWAWFDSHTVDGNAVGVTYPLLDRIAGVTGFAEAMAFVGWLQQAGSVMTLPRFDRHNGKTAKDRALSAKRQGKHREKSNAASVTEVTMPSLPREEKRREEEKQEQSASATADAPLRADPIPYQAIVDAYNTTMTKLPKVRELTTKRKAAIRRVWQESKSRQNADFWLAYFEECEADPFRNGTGPYRAPHEGWRPDFDFLIRSDQVTKVYEAAMSRMERVA